MSEGSANVQTNGGQDSTKQFNKSLWKIWRHKRYIVAILGFFGYMNIYALRTNLSIAIVDMTQLKPIVLANGTTVLEREFNWSSKVQGYILSSFFYGYLLTQLIGGYIATKVGGCRLFGLGIATTATLTLITPWVAKTNVYFLIAVRITEGIFEGVTYPSMHEVWAHWAPPAEKSRLVSIAASGAYFGAVVAMPTCSILASAFGWETIFYVFGAIGLVWYIIWTLLVGDTPEKDKFINPEEVKYITKAINAVKIEEKMKVPWKSLLTSTAVWANTICLTCEGWGFYTMLTFLPQIMTSLLGFNLNTAGILSALPYAATCVIIQMGGYLADFLLHKNYVNTTQVRKLAIITGFMSQTVFILLAGYWTTPVGTSLCLIIGVGLGGFALGALITNPLDIAPKFASVIFGINNTSGSVAGVVSPILTGYIVTDTTSVTQWRIVFYVISGIYFFGSVVSFNFTSGVREPWADGKRHSQKIEPNNGHYNEAMENDNF